MKFLLRCAACFLALWVTTLLFSAQTAVENHGALVGAAVVLGLVNSTLRPMLHVLTLPIGCFTLGISTVLINVGMVWLAVEIAPGVRFTGFWTFAVATVLVSVFMSVINRKD